MAQQPHTTDHSDPTSSGSSWQPVKPASWRERRRYRTGVFRPVQGASFGTDLGSAPNSAGAGDASSPNAFDGGASGEPPKSGSGTPYMDETTRRQPSQHGDAETGGARPSASGTAYVPTAVAADAGQAGTPPKAGAQRHEPPRHISEITGSPHAAAAGAATAQPGAGAPTDTATDGTGNSIAAVIMGVVALVMAASFPIVSIILAVIAFRQASRARARGKKARLGRLFATLGVIVAILSAISGGAWLAGAFNDLLDTGPSQYPERYASTDASQDYTASDDEGSAGEADPATDPAAAEQAVTDLAEAQFGKLENPDDATLQAVAAVIDGDMQEYFGFTHADLGIDPLESARWAMADTSCSLSDVYAFPDDGDGDAFADVIVRDTTALHRVLSNVVYSPEVYSTDYATNPESLTTIAAAYRAALQQPGETEDRFVDAEYVLENGEWKLDDAYWQGTLDSLYGY